ncbi:hypothetical protein ACQX0N_10230 [Clostridium tepidum]
MEKKKNISKTIIIILGVVVVLLLGGILYNSYMQSTSNDRYYQECLERGKGYVKEEDWDAVLHEAEKLEGIIPRDKKLIEQRDLMKSSAIIHKQLDGTE